MARLMRRLAAFLLCLGVCASAQAEPITASIAAWWVAASAVTIATTALTIYSIASSVYGSIQAKKKARAAAQRAAEQEAANLRDRTTTVVSSESPWVTIYGSPAPVGGTVAAVLTSGDRDQIKHVVLLLASHESDGVEKIFIGGDWIGNLDPAGYADGEEFQLASGIPQLRTAEYELVEFIAETEQGSSPTGIGFWNFAVGATIFSGVQAVFDEAGNDVAATVKKGYPPNVLGGNFLVGPVGAKGTVTYWVDGAGSALNIQVHLSPGGVDTADVFLRSARPDLWTVDHKFSGFTYLVISMNLELERFQSGVPEVTVKMRGKKVYDPRTNLTRYSRNNALCLADFISSEVGYKADFATQIEQDTLIASANACDVLIYPQAAIDADTDGATYGGSRARYVCDGMFRSDQDRDATRQQIEDSMVGTSFESAGVWRIMAGAWTTPVMSLTDDDMVAPTSVLQTCNSGTSHFNGVRGTYVNAVRNGVTEDFTPYQNPVFRAIDERDKFHEVTLSFTGNHMRAQQVARVLVEQSRGGFVVQIHPMMFAWPLQPGDRVVLSSRLWAFTNKTFRVQDWVYKSGVPMTLQCVEDEESMWDAADETRADPAPNTSLPNPMLKPGAPLDLVVLSGEDQMVQQDGVMIVRAKVQWAQTNDRYVLNGGIVRVQWRQAADDLVWQSAELPGDSTLRYLLGLAVGHVYVVRVQFASAYASSNWSYFQHELHGLEGPPDSVLGLDVRAELTGIYAYWSEPAGIDLLTWNATQIRRGPSWDLAEGVVLFDGRGKSANLGWFPVGSQAVWAAHHNTIGDFAEPVFETIEILPPAQPLPIAVVNNRNQVSVSWLDCKTTQPIDFYEVRLGDTAESAEVLAQARGTSFETVQPNFGAHRYWVIAVDVAGNRGAPGYCLALTLQSLDSAIANLRPVITEALDLVASIQIKAQIQATNALANTRTKLQTDTLKVSAVVEQNRVESVSVDQALASQITTVAAEFNDSIAFVTETIQSVATAQEATAEQLTVLSSTVGTNQATAVVQYTTLANADQALATQLNALSTTVGDNQALFSSQITTLSDQQGATASEVTILAALAGTNAAGIVAEGNIRAEADSALATQITTVQSNVAGLSASVQSTSNTLADLNGNVAAQYMVRTEVVGSTGKRALAGLYAGVSSTGGGTDVQSEVGVFAGRFVVFADPSSNVGDAPFRVEGGVVYINIAKIKNADIDTLKVAGDALTSALGTTGTGTAALSFTVPAGQVWRAISTGVIGKGPNAVGTRYSQNLALTGATTYLVPSAEISREETEGGSISTFAGLNASVAGIQEFGAGTHTVTCATTDATTGAAVATPITLIVNLQKRGA